MTDCKDSRFESWKLAYGRLLFAALLLASAIPASPADNGNTVTIDATAMGTSTQLGKTANVKVTIYKFSTQDDKQVLVNAFKKGQSRALVHALTKMDAVGRIAITGTLGYDLSYIALIPTPTGRKIRFAANRQIRFGEAYYNGRSMDYDLTAGEFDLDASDKKSSTGVLYPAAQLTINKKGELQFELRQNPWKLTNIIDWSDPRSNK